MASLLLINEPPLQVLPSLALKLGLNEAIILQQIHYWLNPKFNKNYFKGRHWVRNTYEQWQLQFPFWGEKTIRRAIGNLEDSKILITFMTREFKKTKYYSIDYDLLNQLSENPVKSQDLSQSLPSGQDDLIDLDTMTAFCITENTHENSLLPQEDEEEIIKAMIEVWNTKIQSKLNGTKIVHITPKRKNHLIQVLKCLFAYDLSKWGMFCTQIASNRFLMGGSTSGFRISLDWVLNIENATKIIEGAIYDKSPDTTTNSTEITLNQVINELETKLINNPYKSIWVEISHHLINKIGYASYRSWFSKLNPIEILENQLVLQTDSVFIKDNIQNNFINELQASAELVFTNSINIPVKILVKRGAE